VLARIACANASRASVLVSVHMNSFGDPSVGGATTFYDPDRAFSAANARLAGLAQATLIRALHGAGWPVPSRGIVADTLAGSPTLSNEAARYGHFLLLGPSFPGWLSEPSAMPGILIEPLFLTRPTEADIAASAHGQAVLGAAIASFVEGFLAPPATPSTTPSAPPR
jgi:N-acetylmuramoyl-L-alanine amidase